MIETFIAYLRTNRGLSPHTLKSYREDLKDFASFINCYHPGERWSTITKVMIDEYVVQMSAEDYEASTIKRHVSALRTFYKTCMAMGTIKENPARFVSTPKLGKVVPKVIELEAITRCLEDGTVSKECKAAVAIIFETGIRLQELLDMRLEDIDAKTRTIKVHGKGNKERTVYYGNLTAKFGRKWVVGKFDQRQVRRMVFEALKPYSKGNMLSPHALRHTFASQCLANGMPMECIQRLLGHEHITTTEIYAQLPAAKMTEYYNKFMPTL